MNGFDISISRLICSSGALLFLFKKSQDFFKKIFLHSWSFINRIMNEESIETENKEISELDISLNEEVENGKNKHLVKCKFCPSKILNPRMGTYLQSKFDLPMMARKKKSEKEEEVEYETVTHFWQINDMYTFENISFSNTVEKTKYLACADCEVGPVGYFNMDTKISYVALGRVNHVK